MKPKNKYYGEYSNYGAALMIYFISVIIAAVVIMPNEEGHFAIGLLKAAIWPIYSLLHLFGMA